MKAQLINFMIPNKLLGDVDKIAEKQSKSRSSILRDAAQRLIDEERQREKDFSLIFESGRDVNLEEDEAFDLVDKIRNKLQINK